MPIVIAAAIAIGAAGPVQAVQIMDLVRVKGAEAGKLRGFGLVVGLQGTGDGSNFEPAINALAQVIRNSLDESTTFEAVKDSKNVAVVALEVHTPPAGAIEGDRFDVHVSAVGTAKSLKGGRLLMMPMVGPLPNSPRYAFASGKIEVDGEELLNTGVIRNGAQMVKSIRTRTIDENGRMTLVIHQANANYQTAVTIAGTINDLMLDGTKIAEAMDAKSVVVQIPEPDRVRPGPFIAAMLGSFLDPDFIQTGGLVRINRTRGTIIIGGDVQISPVVISHGELTITMITPPPQPTPEAPRVEQQHTIGIDPEQRGGTRLANLIAAFNQLKVDVQDRIAIIEEIHNMGKLHARLVFED